MKILILATLFFGIWIISVSFCAGQPAKGIVEKNSPANTHPSTEPTKIQKATDNETIRSILSVVTKIQQQQTYGRQAEESTKNESENVEGKLVKYTWWLVAVGFLQAVILFLTVGAIYAQTKTAKNSERAWVLIKRIGNPPKGWRSGKIAGFSPGIVFEFNAYGTTPVKIRESRFVFEPVPVKKGIIPSEPDLPEVPDYTRASPATDIPRDGMTFPPDSPFILRLGRVMNETEMNDLNLRKTVLCVYGSLKYRDAFEKKRETRICYVYYIPQGGVLESPDGIEFNPEGFRIGGPDPYNKAT